MDTILALGLFALVIVVLSFESGWNSLFSRDRNDLVFEHKNHLYGAYSIRKNYGKYLAIAVFSTIGFATAVALSPKFLRGDGEGDEDSEELFGANPLAKFDGRDELLKLLKEYY